MYPFKAFLVKPDPSDGHCYEQTNGGSVVQLGDLPWVAHNLWWQYRYTLDDEALATATVILEKSMGYYLRLMELNTTTGKYHLPLAESPEYASARDTNYDLALFRWGVGVLLHIADSLNHTLKSHPSFALWSDVAQNLTPFPTDPGTGLLIGDGVPLKSGHRHWSHLFSIFPTALLNPGAGAVGTAAEHSPLATFSLDHYANENGAAKFNPSIANGFPRVAIATMSGMAGRRDAAYRNISNWFLSTSEANGGFGGGSFGVNMGPSTMYQEAGGSPCNESPLGAAFAIQTWLLSSWNYGAPEKVMSQSDVIRLFPAMPTTWSTASIGYERVTAHPTERGFLHLCVCACVMGELPAGGRWYL